MVETWLALSLLVLGANPGSDMPLALRTWGSWLICFVENKDSCTFSITLKKKMYEIVSVKHMVSSSECYANKYSQLSYT